MKIFFDGDRNYPSLAVTGTKDYIATGWGQDEYFNTGSLYANKNNDDAASRQILLMIFNK